jgi:magnesium chelatase family protein
MVAHYRQRVSGPLLDRFEVQVEVPPLPVTELRSGPSGEPSSAVATRVARARGVQTERLEGSGVTTNAAMPPSRLRRHALLDDASRSILVRAIERLGLSARAHDGILRVARTIADLDGSEAIGAAHVAEAVQYRVLDRSMAAADRGQNAGGP